MGSPLPYLHKVNSKDEFAQLGLREGQHRYDDQPDPLALP